MKKTIKNSKEISLSKKCFKIIIFLLKSKLINPTLAKKFGLRGIPTSNLFNKKGEEFARVVGSINFVDEKFIEWLRNYN